MSHSSKEQPIDNHPIELKILTLDGKPFPIPIDGSLGLLALGDIGLIAWRKKRKALEEQSANPSSSPTVL